MKKIFDLQSLTVKIPRVLLQWIDAQCEEGGHTRTDIVRDAVLAASGKKWADLVIEEKDEQKDGE